MSKAMNIPIFIPHFGCPNDCVFCNQRKISGRDKVENEIEIRQFIEEAILTSRGRETEIAFFGGSFTGLTYEIQKQYLAIGKEYVDKHNLKGIRISTRPDYISTEILEFLSKYPVSSIELGVQSMNQEVLDATKRNHSVKDVYKAVDLINASKIDLGVQMMIGLPLDTREKTIETAKILVSFMPKTVRIYPTLVIEDTELEKMYKKGSYEPIELEEAVKTVSMILPMFVENKIKVIRVGLQDNKELKNGGYLAGPYHPAFKELVLDDIFYNNIVYRLIDQKLIDLKTETKNIILYSSSKFYNRIIGHKKRNQIRFLKIGIIVKVDKALKDDVINIIVK